MEVITGSRRWYSPGKCCLDQLLVDEKFRGKGIGKALMEVADNEAKKHGCKVKSIFAVRGFNPLHSSPKKQIKTLSRYVA